MIFFNIFVTSGRMISCSFQNKAFSTWKQFSFKQVTLEEMHGWF